MLGSDHHAYNNIILDAKKIRKTMFILKFWADIFYHFRDGIQNMVTLILKLKLRCRYYYVQYGFNFL